MRSTGTARVCVLRGVLDTVACGRRATGRGHFGIRHRRHQCARDRLPSRGRVMPAHPLPDGRVPVLLSAHDETLISQDARAILDYLDRAARGRRSDGWRRVHPAASATGAATPCGRAGRGPRRTRGRRCPRWPAAKSTRWSLGPRKALACTSRSYSPARATSGHRWAQTLTGSCRPTGRRPTDAPRRSSMPGCRLRCPI